jgi:hypothetical protein
LARLRRVRRVAPALAALACGLTLAAPGGATEQACGPCGIVRSNLLIGWKAASGYAATHGGSLPTGRAFVDAVLDLTAGLDPGIGGLAKARRLNDPAAVLIDPASTASRLILWGGAANRVVVSLTGRSGGGPTVHYGG